MAIFWHHFHFICVLICGPRHVGISGFNIQQVSTAEIFYCFAAKAFYVVEVFNRYNVIISETAFV